VHELGAEHRHVHLRNAARENPGADAAARREQPHRNAVTSEPRRRREFGRRCEAYP
jgi:hypothetical protein